MTQPIALIVPKQGHPLLTVEVFLAKPKKPIVLVNRSNGKAWSANPGLYDANVILPPALSLKSFGDRQTFNGQGYMNVADPSHLSLSTFTALDSMYRPSWLTLNGERLPFPISATMCRMQLPCVVEAQYAKEKDDAVAADRYAFLKSDAITNLYLFPGNYRLRVVDSNGKTISEQPITVSKH